MNIEKQSSKLIKPWIRTPPTLRHYKIGFIDELAPSLNLSVVLFYSMNHDHDPKFVTRLEHSLEKTLTRFYPLTGRYVDEMHTIDCNDEGVWFTHAKANIKMQDILATEENVKLDHFIPSERWDSDTLLVVQATVFECGGVTLGVRATHKIADASTLCTFINEWAATNLEENDHKFTVSGFNSSSLFPGRSLPPASLQSISDDDMSSKYIRKTFKFSESAISNLKAKTIADGNISTRNRRLSKVQLVSAIIWKALIDFDQANNNPRESILFKPVNLREKTASLIPM